MSCLILCDPMDCSPPGSSVHGDSPSKNTGAGCHALLQGIFPTQGSAADIMKLAMVEIYRRFQLEGIRSKMIMQVHDEVVIDTLKEELESVKRIVKEAMESVATLRVPLIAEVNSASNWLDAH